MAHSSDEFDDIDEFDHFGIEDLDDSALLQLDQIESKLVSDAVTQQPAVRARTLSGTASSSSSRIQRLPSITSGNTRPALGTAQLQAMATKGSRSWMSKSGAETLATTSARPIQRVSSTGTNTSTQPASSGGARQMTLFGQPAILNQSRTAKVVSSSPGHITISSQTPTTAASGSVDNAGSGLSSCPSWQSKVGSKTWDREAYLHRENAKNRVKDEFGEPIDVDALALDHDVFRGVGSRNKATRMGDDDWDAHSKFVNLLPPPPPDARRTLPPPQTPKCKIDLEAAKTWIYPTNMEKRDYQYNIVQKSLFNNVLVALPTGLGKTFIAAVVILNFFRWFPDGKILFLAPSRPLVDQQKTACHRICGLPWDCAIDLTGSTASSRRGDYWQTKRIFYMTPQTLENDIRKGRCDPRDVVCIVVDEAHRARGRYAYGNVIGLLMEVNPHFRVLALSATPGKDSDSVQQVVDQLHINQIEIRTEEAIDVQRYVFRKREEIINVSLGKDLNQVKDKWAKLMQTQMDPLMKAGLIRNQDPVLLHPFAVNAIAKDRSRAEILGGKPWLRSNISELGAMALSMQYLMEQSSTMFYNRLKERSMGHNSKGKKTSTSKQQIYANSNTTFAEIMRELELMQDRKGRILHPKMVKLRNVLIEHFDNCKTEQVHNAEAYAASGHDVFGNTPKSAELANFSSSSQADTRVMVFCSYRECCDEIVSYLNDSGFRATEFVGQSKAKSGKKGMSQKEQERVILDFKAGKYNVLVATSIGEEGLDIGSVDLTVCYEAVKDSIRMLQRIGRTGRKREGKIVVLISEGREQHNWQHSKDNYKTVQKEVDSRLFVELFDDVDRMVPDGISPRPVLKEVEQPEFEPSMVSEGRSAAKTPRTKKDPKPKKDPRRNMPAGGSIVEGFRKASTLAKRKVPSSSDESSDQSDSDKPPSYETHSQKVRRLLDAASDKLGSEFDKENLSLNIRTTEGRTKVAAKRIASTPPSSPDISSPGTGRLTTHDPIASLAIDTPCVLSDRSPPLPSTSSSSRPIAAGNTATHTKQLGAGSRNSVRRPSRSKTLSLRKSEEADAPHNKSSNSIASNGLLHAKSPRSRVIASAVVLDQDEDEFDDNLAIDLSMEMALARVEAEAEAAAQAQVTRESHVDESLLSSPFKATFSDHQDRQGSPLSFKIPSSASLKQAAGRVKPHFIMEALIAEEAEKEREQQEGRRASTSVALRSMQKVQDSPTKSSMGPPDSIPRRAGGARARRAVIESPDTAPSARKPELPLGVDALGADIDYDPLSSSPIKAPVRRRGRLQKASSIPNNPSAGDADTSPTAAKGKTRAQSRIRRDTRGDEEANAEDAKGDVAEELSRAKATAKGRTGKKTVPTGGRKKRKITNSPTSRALFQYEADRSTDEEVHGERDEDDSGLGSSDEDDSDREAVGDFIPTQAPRGYHQQSVYLQSMLSQHAPPEFSRTRHAPFPGLGGRFGVPVTPRRRGEMRRAQVPSSESRKGMGSDDRYSEDSFVVNDEDEIVYNSDSDGLLDSSQF